MLNFWSLLVAMGVFQPPQPAPAKPLATPEITVPVKQATGPKIRALKYPLLPDALDLQPGNAALHWLRAGRVADDARRTLVEAEKARNKAGGKPAAALYDRESDWARTTPLAALPVAEIKKHFDSYRLALKLAQQAATYEHCDWGMPPLTTDVLLELPLNELQALRHLATIVSMRIRLELREGHIDEAISFVRTGFTLARHVASGPTLVQGLVGIAIASMMMARLDELLQDARTPNLYWSLATLPSPLIDLGPVVRGELAILLRSFPQLRELEKETLTKEQVNRLIDDLIRLVDKTSGGDKPAWLRSLGTSALVAWNFADAKKALLREGWAEERLKQMPPQQVVALQFVSAYQRLRDDMVKWCFAPPPVSLPALQKLENEIAAQAAANPNNILMVLARLLLPAIARVRQAEVRTDRQIAILRCVEAIRLHVAENGKLPVKLSDIAAVPLPLDPITGKGFDEYYQREGQEAKLKVPAVPRWNFPERIYRFVPAR